MRLLSRVTSARGTELASAADLALVVPAEETARIQEMQVLALHLISELVDRWACETDTVDN